MTDSTRKVRMETDYDRDLLYDLDGKTVLEAVELLLDLMNQYGPEARLDGSFYAGSTMHLRYPVLETDAELATRLEQEARVEAEKQRQLNARLAALQTRLMKKH